MKLIAMPALLLALVGSAAGEEAGDYAPPTKAAAAAAFEKMWVEGQTSNSRVLTVLFQEIQAGRPKDGVYPFRISAIVHDFGAGNAEINYPGSTCTWTFTKTLVLLRANAFDEWEAPINTDYVKECERNPSVGVPSIPLDTLPGKRALEFVENE